MITKKSLINKTKQTKNNKDNKNKTRALVLFSGGLDSRLVVKILQEQGITPILVMFKLPFGGGCCNDEMCSFRFAQNQKAELKIIDCTKGKLFKEYLEVVKSPKHKHGSAMNPCIDCRIFIIKHSRTLMKKFKCDFIATGEVLGERPMSQHKQAMDRIEKDTDFQDQILRPLSAKLLPETNAEKQGLVKRSKLYSIQGRQRQPQFDLAKKYNIQYPHPAGGCILCEKLYSIKLRDLLKHKQTKDIPIEELQILRGFRHLRSTSTHTKIILGRDQTENTQLELINKTLKWNIIIPTTPGPTAVYESKQDTQLVKKIISAYSSKDKKLRKQFDELLIIKDKN